MTIEEDIDYALFNFPCPGIEIAYTILSRLRQVKEALNEDEDLDTFAIAGFIPPTIRIIVSDYLEKNITKKYAVYLLDHELKGADEILKKRGYDANHIFEEEDRVVKFIEHQLEEYSILLDRLKQLDGKEKV